MSSLVVGRCSGVGQKVGLRASPARQIRQSRVTNFSFRSLAHASQPASQNLALPFPHLFRPGIRVQNEQPVIQWRRGRFSQSVSRRDDVYTPMEGPLGCLPTGACVIHAEVLSLG